MGDRLQQTVNGNTTSYALDINTSLPEVLSDGEFTYLYGLDNIAQINAGGTEYFLGDALNSTRQLTNELGAITLAGRYTPWGDSLDYIGTGNFTFGYFGGGTVQGGQGVTQGRGNTRNRIAGQEKDPDPYDVELNNAEIFWQGIPLGSELTTKVTFTQLDKSATRQKPQSNGMWGEDIIQVMYDVPNNRVQVWKFEGKAWVQVGSDIPLKFVDGDVFTVFAGKDGSIEIYRNEKLLSTRQPLDVWIPSPTPTVTETPIKRDASVPQLANFAPVSLRLPAPVSAPLQQSGPVTINYVYDPLYRLTESNYSTGDSYLYTYDAVGNRLTQETLIGSVPLTTNYGYDDANRLTSVDSVNYTWDNNGNLINDGVNAYTGVYAECSATEGVPPIG